MAVGNRHLGDEGRPPALQQATQRTRTSSHGAWVPSGGLRTASTGGLGAGGRVLDLSPSQRASPLHPSAHSVSPEPQKGFPARGGLL